MDHFQDFLTLAATVVEYFFFAYLSVAFMVYSLKSPTKVQQPRPVAVSQTTWERSVEPASVFAGMAG